MDRLLLGFRSAFEGQPYLHRNSTIGAGIASVLYEDLLSLGRAPKFADRVNRVEVVVNSRNLVSGRVGRRGDGTLGDLVPGAAATKEEGFNVRRGPVATLHIGAEVKIIATKMTAQFDRVMNDLKNQASTFRDQSANALAVGIVGVNFADVYTGYEGTRQFDAKSPPSRSAPEIVRRLDEKVRAAYDEFLVLRFSASNRAPYSVHWVDERGTREQYSSILLRLSQIYEARF